MYEKPDRIGMMSSGVLGKIYELKLEIHIVHDDLVHNIYP